MRGKSTLLLVYPSVFADSFAYPSQLFPIRFNVIVDWKSHHPASLLQSTVEDNHEQVLSEMTRFFAEDMVDPGTNRFYYQAFPSDGERQHVHFPIRDLAAAWDATKALEFCYSLSLGNLSHQQLQLEAAVKCTLLFYSASFCRASQQGDSAGVSLEEKVLLEAPNIGHSALLLLGTSSALRLGILRGNEVPVDSLVKGVLSMQLENGAFSVDFADRTNFHRGIEFFPGEAILALMHAYATVNENLPRLLEDSTQSAILPAMEQAFDFYSEYYREADVDVNYNIWQALAFSKVYDALPADGVQKKAVADYVLSLCQEICLSRSWRHQLARGRSFYINLETIEIACGLDAVAEGCRVAQHEQKEDMLRFFQLHTRNAADFLRWAQDQVPSDSPVGRGGLGYGGIQILEQRIDVTGHAISALTKLWQLSMTTKAD